MAYGDDLCEKVGEGRPSALQTSGALVCVKYNLNNPDGYNDIVDYLQNALYNDPLSCFGTFMDSCGWQFDNATEQVQGFATWMSNYQDLLEYLLTANAGVVAPDCLSVLPYDEQIRRQTGNRGEDGAPCEELPDWDGSSPLRLDYDELGYVSPVTNQAGGACYVHAAVNWFASQVLLLNLTDVSGKYKPTNKTVMSVQPVLDCMYPGFDADNPCKGGTAANVTDLLEKRGTTSSERYPYFPRPYMTLNNLPEDDCSVPNNPACATLETNTSMLYKLPKNLGNLKVCALSQSQLAQLLADRGPAIMSYSAGKLGFSWQPWADADRTIKVPWKEDPATNGNMSYCDPRTRNNHAVLLTGYDMTDPENPYFIYKNSWGPHYGDDGFAWVAMSPLNSTEFYDRNFTGQCGITATIYVWEDPAGVAATLRKLKLSG